MSTDLPLAGPIADCKLDLDGLRVQRGRYARLGESAVAVERADDHLVIRFDAALDEALLRETVAVESECCPFFRFDFSPAARTLSVDVSEASQLPALDAIAFALGAASPTPRRQ